MAASHLSSFTISQPFLGAPLQFTPALGTPELDALVDAFVSGSASRKDKLSDVTLDFFNHATVDLNTGALVRRYEVLLPWMYEESPTVSQSSGFSPPLFTPSPASSAALADSGYGSFSMTPPGSRRGAVARGVVKKARKETKKAAEAQVRIPGFQIMTRDGVDVTSTAGRGTKTKEQREHAHLMRIMKACDACKRKKIRCDPSHRLSHNDMSRTSTSTAASFSRPDPSPTAAAPSLPREASCNSQESLPSFSTGAIDDFVLFPNDFAGWNSADKSLPDYDMQKTDLSDFNFDLDIDLNDYSNPALNVDSSFDFSAYDRPSMQSSHAAFMDDQYGLHQWASAIGDEFVVHLQPHPLASTQDSGQLESSWAYSDSQLSEPLISPRRRMPIPGPENIPAGAAQYSACLVVLNNLQVIPSGIFTSSFLFCLPLLAVAFPQQFTPATVLLLACPLLCAFAFALIDTFRGSCTNWIDNDLVPAMAKLLLCSVIASQPPSTLWKKAAWLSPLLSMLVVASVLHTSGSNHLKSSSQKFPSNAEWLRGSK